MSYPQQLAVTATGLIWSRFSTQITPVSPGALRAGSRPCLPLADSTDALQVNYNLLAVNAAMACTGLYQLSRKAASDMSKDSPLPATWTQQQLVRYEN